MKITAIGSLKKRQGQPIMFQKSVIPVMIMTEATKSLLKQ